MFGLSWPCLNQGLLNQSLLNQGLLWQILLPFEPPVGQVLGENLCDLRHRWHAPDGPGPGEQMSWAK